MKKMHFNYFNVLRLYSILFIIFSLFFSFTAYSKVIDEKWIEKEITGVQGENESFIDFKKRLKEQAKSELYDIGGTIVSKSVTVINREAVDVTDKQISRAIVLEAKELPEQEQCKDIQGTYLKKCTFKYSFRVMIPEKYPDPNFKLKLSLNKQNYTDGEEVVIKIESNQDCYLNIYNIYLDNDTTAVLFPNDFYKENFLKANHTFQFPSEEMRKNGLKLKVKSIENKKESIELIKVFAIKSKNSLKDEMFKENLIKYHNKGETGVLSDLYTKIAKELDFFEFTEKTIAYTIKND